MQILDNINNTIKDDLQKEVKKGSKISIAAACFSIYAYQELKKQLDRLLSLPRKPQKPKESFIFPVYLESAAYMGLSLR